MNKLFIEVPTWLGDCVMSTPAIENIVKAYPDVKITIMGSFVSTAIFEAHPNVEKIIVDEGRNAKSRLGWLYKTAKNMGHFDVALSLRRTLTSKLFMMFTQATLKANYTRTSKKVMHQVVRYNDFINKTFQLNSQADDLKIYFDTFIYDKPTLGINPGASYGSAKRWYPEKFASVAIALSKYYDIVIFGGPGEVDIARDIENVLKKEKIQNYANLAGKTSVKDLCEKIGGLDMLITGDSGPMHIAAAFKVPTVSIFGPTNDLETSQWKNPKGVLVKKVMECAPCMKRTCPLGHHECMKLISSDDVLNVVHEIGASK